MELIDIWNINGYLCKVRTLHNARLIIMCAYCGNLVKVLFSDNISDVF